RAGPRQRRPSPPGAPRSPGAASRRPPAVGATPADTTRSPPATPPRRSKALGGAGGHSSEGTAPRALCLSTDYRLLASDYFPHDPNQSPPKLHPVLDCRPPAQLLSRPDPLLHQHHGHALLPPHRIGRIRRTRSLSQRPARVERALPHQPVVK